MLHSRYSLRSAEKDDLQRVSDFIEGDALVHRHLDWKAAIDWLGYKPFWLLEKDHDLSAVLACPADPEHICWIRLFAVKQDLAAERAWQVLFDKCLEDLSFNERRIIIASVVLKEWFTQVLKSNGFIHHQEIVVLEWDNNLPAALPTSPDLVIRPMRFDDLPDVAEVDRCSFAQLWQNSQEGLTLAFRREGISTVALLGGQIVGYQISTTTSMNTHLARLAVLPEKQHRNIGFTLVHDMLNRSLQRKTWQVTVNTQHDNSSSMALYKKMGFQKTGEHFPVYIYIKT